MHDMTIEHETAILVEKFALLYGVSADDAASFLAFVGVSTLRGVLKSPPDVRKALSLFLLSGKGVSTPSHGATAF